MWGQNDWKGILQGVTQALDPQKLKEVSGNRCGLFGS